MSANVLRKKSRYHQNRFKMKESKRILLYFNFSAANRIFEYQVSGRILLMTCSVSGLLLDTNRPPQILWRIQKSGLEGFGIFLEGGVSAFLHKYQKNPIFLSFYHFLLLFPNSGREGEGGWQRHSFTSPPPRMHLCPDLIVFDLVKRILMVCQRRWNIFKEISDQPQGPLYNIELTVFRITFISSRQIFYEQNMCLQNRDRDAHMTERQIDTATQAFRYKRFVKIR